METLQDLENKIQKQQTLVVDSSMVVRGLVEWSRAMTLVLTKEAYTLLSRSDGSVVRSQNQTFDWPLVVVLNKYVGFTKKRVITNDSLVSKRMILTRDNWTCQYCGNYGDTIDHIIPKSRGGLNTWGNLCCACLKCNSQKEDKTPKEAGMKSPVINPDYTSQRYNDIQAAFYKALETSM